MTPEEPKPLPEEPEEEYGPEYLNWKPLTREDFGPGEEWCRDVFFAFRDDLDRRQVAAEEREALKQAAKADE